MIVSIWKGVIALSQRNARIPKCLVFGLTAMRSFLHSHHHLPFLLPDDFITLLELVRPLSQKHQACTGNARFSLYKNVVNAQRKEQYYNNHIMKRIFQYI